MKKEDNTQAGITIKPIRPGLFVEGPPPFLLGSKCKESGKVFFPAEVMNPDTHKAGTMEPVRIEGSGALFSFAKVVRGVVGFPSPYVLGIVQLDAGPSMMAQLEGWQDVVLRQGMRVELVIGQIKQDPSGAIVIGPKFRPIPE